MNYYSIGTIREINFKTETQKVLLKFSGTDNYSINSVDKVEYNLFVNTDSHHLEVKAIKKDIELEVTGLCEAFIGMLFQLYRDKQLIKISINDSNQSDVDSNNNVDNKHNVNSEINKIIEWNIINE